MYLRLTNIIIVAGAALLGPLWLFALLALLHAFLFSGFDLLPIGVLVDARFWDPERSPWYLYTTISVMMLVATTMLRPYLRFYA